MLNEHLCHSSISKNLRRVLRRVAMKASEADGLHAESLSHASLKDACL